MKSAAQSANPTDAVRPGGRRLRTLTITLLSVAGIMLLLYFDGLVGQHMASPLGGESLSYGLLFVTGLLTGFHCVGMCGALVISYSVPSVQSPRAGYRAHLFYGCGKLLSYTGIGALFGGLGAIVTFTPYLRGMAGIFAGVFLLVFGLSLLNIFPFLNRFRIKMPAFLMRFIGQGVKRHSHPFIIGLLNGLMIICGPLQAMYIMAAGTGSPVRGANMLLVFGLGTLPVMMGFGALTSALSANVAPRLVKASAFIVIALGAIMANRGLAMTGSGYDFHSLTGRWQQHRVSDSAGAQQVIRMQVTAKGFEPDHFNLVRGRPVRWVIEGKEINYCNHRIVVPALELEFDVQKGENVVEFTPRQIGVIPWSCWMGMIPGSFLVHEDPGLLSRSPAEEPRNGGRVWAESVERAAALRDRVRLWLERQLQR